MPPLPTGTVTFLFSDIEGSTQLARSFPDSWPAVQARYRAIFEAAITAHQGHVFRAIGDEVNAAFEAPSAALAAAHAAQSALLVEDWGPVGSLHVRLALHTGPASPHLGEYEGYLTLSHAKRLVSAAHGRQVLLSEATASLLHDSSPTDLTLRDLGEHRLRDFDRPEHIYQLVSPGLPAEFPPLNTLESSPNHLPPQLTSFIGRSKELGDLSQLLSTQRLITLTGPGGSGKTRLALQAASQLLDQFPDGSFFVALASLTDPRLVLSTIAQSLGLPETPGRSLLESLKDHLQNRSLLLLLDNFEQVIAAAPLVADLLLACPKIKILVTSREALHVSGEQELPVPPLALPDLTQPPSAASISQVAAVELFVQRAVAARPDFTLTDQAAPAVAEICHRLDGLPLAIELAAARIKLLPPPAMLARLEHRLEFLTGGPRDLPARQQTLRSAIAWSCDLLDETERAFFRRLSVFVGGFTLEAADAVAADPPTQASALDQLGSLVDKSLLQQVEAAGEPRFLMLETLREFALEQLDLSGEQGLMRSRHANFFLSLAEQAAASLESAGQVNWINRIELEHDNLRAALEWSMIAQGTADLCVRLADTLALFWETRGYFSEGRQRLSSILSTGAALGQTAARAKLLARAAELAYRQSDYSATTAFAQESLSIYRQLDDRPGIASALLKLGNAATERGDFAAASGFLEGALSAWRELGDEHGTARALISLGWVALRQGDFPLARLRLEEALALSRQLDDTRRVGFALSGLGEVDLRQGNFTRAAQLVEESLQLRRQLGNKWGIGVSLGILGWIAIRQGNWDRAITLLSESLDLRREIGDQSGIAWCLERLSEVAIAHGQAEDAARLLGAGSALRASIGSAIDPVDRPEVENQVKYLRGKLGAARFKTAWEAGRTLTLDQAVKSSIEH